MKNYDVIIVGGGAAGLFAGITAAKRKKSVLIVEQANQVGRKILMSGGGRCNFTNMYTEPENFISANPHFCKSALSQYSQWDFIDLVARNGVAYHEKTLGQLFCDNSAKEIVNLLLSQCSKFGVEVKTKSKVDNIQKIENGFNCLVNGTKVFSSSLIVATGGLSIPSMGPHGWGYEFAKSLGLPLKPTSAALVPFVMSSDWQTQMKELSGSSLNARVSTDNQSFLEGLLFTHRGLSGPSILQISSYWKPGTSIEIDLCPDYDLLTWLLEQKQSSPKVSLKNILSQHLSKKLAIIWLTHALLFKLANQKLLEQTIGQCNDSFLQELALSLNQFMIKPDSTEGYKTAEVTLGGVDTDVLSSKTMMVKSVPGLFFIGEVVDVTGHLGGFNFQWAWSSGFVAGQNV